MSPDADVLVSVVIPCYNGADVLGRQLDALQRQTNTESWEIIVADNGSTDDSAAIAAQHSGPIEVVVCDAGGRRGINHARNVGVRHARGRIILLCDADDEVAEGWLSAMLDAFAAGATLVGGRVIRVDPAGERIGVPDDGLRNELRFLPWPQGLRVGHHLHLRSRRHPRPRRAL